MKRNDVIRGGLICLVTAILAFYLPMDDGLGQSKKLRVGVSLPEAQNPFYVALGQSIAKAFRDEGLEVTLLSANADVNEQVSNINDLVASKVDAILMSPLDTEGPAPAVQRAQASGIPIFMVARTLDEKYSKLWKTYIGLNYVEVGAMKGKWLADTLKPGKIAMLLGPAGALFAVDQAKGFRQTIEKAGFQVVWAQNSTQTRENGLKLAEDALVAHRDLAAIYASNDDLALGASQAVRAAGLRGKVATIGTNGAPPALAAIHNGDMSATILLDPIQWGQMSAKIVIDYLVKKQEPKSQFSPLVVELVTEKNAYELIPPPMRERLGVKPKN
jgi:ribose transport system substrate-binding protein